MQALDARQIRGQEIAKLEGQIKRIDAYSYKVLSQSGDGEYDVINSELGWLCSCPDHMYRGVRCKHTFAVEFSLAVRHEAEVKRIEPITDVHTCIYCRSNDLLKDGIRHNKHGDIQKFYCKACGHYFTVNLGFEKMKHNPKGITTAMQLYFSGESLRSTAKSLHLLGMEVSHQTIHNWITKYVGLMEKYLDKITPNVSDTWRADEIYMKIKGDMKYLFAVMDDETRFWIAQEVADTKFSHDARYIFRKSKEAMGKKPKTIITDGLRAYNEAYLKEFWAVRKEERTKHIRHIRLQGDMNNNKMERLNGEIRDREKTMRGLKRKDTPILKGYQLFHNFVRPHKGLDGKTPAEACGIKVEGENKWMTIIQNASSRSA